MAFSDVFSWNKHFVFQLKFNLFVSEGSIDTKSTLFQVMAWRQTGAKPLPETLMIQLTDTAGINELTLSSCLSTFPCQCWSTHHPVSLWQRCLTASDGGLWLLVWEWLHALCAGPLPLWESQGLRWRFPSRLYRRRYRPDQRMVSCIFHVSWRPSCVAPCIHPYVIYRCEINSIHAVVLGLGTESWHQLITDISNRLINLESKIQTDFWESVQLYYRKWSSHFGDSNHHREAGSSFYSK